jgi:hypothetical protein
MAEVYLCGNCNRTQETSRGEKCVSCGGRTISWNNNERYESFVDAVKRWFKIFGK